MGNNNQNLNAKSVIFKEGQPAGNLYIVAKGSVVCLKASKDRLIPVFVARENDIIGENAMQPESHYSYSTIALTPVELVAVPASDFKQVLTQAPPWLVDLSQTMIKRFENTASIVAENRVLHSSIMSEEDFTSALEVEYKKMLS